MANSMTEDAPRKPTDAQVRAVADLLTQGMVKQQMFVHSTYFWVMPRVGFMVMLAKFGDDDKAKILQSVLLNLEGGIEAFTEKEL